MIMTTITIAYPDGRVEERPATPEEEAQIAADAAGAVDRAWAELRFQRNGRLSACDWTQVNDSPVDKYSWAEYRQQLRDLPANTTDPFAPVWPTPPA